jgi:hypothetical protein
MRFKSEHHQRTLEQSDEDRKRILRWSLEGLGPVLHGHGYPTWEVCIPSAIPRSYSGCASTE